MLEQTIGTCNLGLCEGAELLLPGGDSLTQRFQPQPVPSGLGQPRRDARLGHVGRVPDCLSQLEVERHADLLYTHIWHGTKGGTTRVRTKEAARRPGECSSQAANRYQTTARFLNTSYVEQIALRWVHTLERFHSEVFALDGLLDHFTRDKPTHDGAAGPIGRVLGASMPEVGIEYYATPRLPQQQNFFRMGIRRI